MTISVFLDSLAVKRGILGKRLPETRLSSSGARNSYIPGMFESLARFWVDQMQKKRVVLQALSVLGIANSLLHEEKSLMRCGGGWINYAIQTDGYIIPCPTMWGMKEYYLGHIKDADPLKLRQSVCQRKTMQ